VSRALNGLSRQPDAARLINCLSASPHWAMQFQDDQALVFLRQNS